MHDRTLPQVEPSEDVPRVHTVKLVLPLPPRVSQMGSVSRIAAAKKKNRWRRRIWAAACEQVPPMATPPEHVVATVKWYVGNRMDEGDNMHFRAKWIWDALKQEQANPSWRHGIAESKGYIVDDDPGHLHVTAPTQEIDRENPRLEITLRWQVPEEPEAA